MLPYFSKSEAKERISETASKSNLQVTVLGVAVPVLGLDGTLRKSCAQGDPAVGPAEDHSSFFLPILSHDAHLPLCEISATTYVTSMVVYNFKLGKACNRNGRRGIHIGFWWERQKERDQ